jgi:hypothetical protein
MTDINNSIVSEVHDILEKYDKEKNLFRLIEYCKNFYGIELLESNLSPEFKYICTRANDYLDYFAKTISKNQELTIYELKRFIDCITHYEEDIVETEPEEISKEIQELEVATKEFQDELLENTQSDGNSSDTSDMNQPFLITTIKKVFMFHEVIGHFELKYVKFDYDNRNSIEENLSYTENIYFNDKIIFSDTCSQTKEAENFFEIFGFKYISFIQFSEFMSYLFDTDLETISNNNNESPKSTDDDIENMDDCDNNSDNDDNNNNDDDITNYDLDNLYNIKNDFDGIVIKYNSENTKENLVFILDECLKTNLFIKNIDNEEMKMFFDKISNVRYDIHKSKTTNDDICKIISFDVFVNEIMTFKYVSFNGIATKYCDFHNESINNIYVNDVLILNDSQETTDYTKAIYQMINFSDISFENFVKMIYFIFINTN